MARPKDDERRRAILTAATRIIASQGLSASTASIAKEAGISTGSLFTYFPSKSDLFNQLYVELKCAMAAAALGAAEEQGDVRSQMARVWAGWLGWAASDPDRRRALAQLAVSDEISPESRDIGHRAMADIGALLERSRKNGAMRDAPLNFVSNILNAVAEATADFVIADPANAKAHREAGFEAMWRIIS